jgi:vacuolar iron transporter family protein
MDTTKSSRFLLFAFGHSHHYTGGRSTTLITGLLAAVAGALSMGTSEFVSVSSQRDAERSDVEAETQAQITAPFQELQELTDLFVDRGVEAPLAMQVAVQLSAKDAVAAHCQEELGFDSNALSNPCLAAVSGCFSFLLGAAIPIITMALVPDTAQARIIALIGTTAFGFVAAGVTAAKLSGAGPCLGAVRLLVGGALELGVTYAIGVAVSGA